MTCLMPQEKTGASSVIQRLWLKNWFKALLLIAMILVAYWPAMHGGFIWDDDTHISTNDTLRSRRGLWEIWFQPGATCQYYPLSFTLFWVGYHLWGLNPLGFHLLTLMFHGLASVLLWQVLKRLEVRAAWLAGAIFALHPVNVMSAAWMTELKNTLAGTLILAAAWAYVRFAGLGVYKTTVPGGSDWRYALLSLALFQLAMFAKTAVSFLPVTLLLLIWWKGERIVRRLVWPLLVMFGIAAGMGLLTFHIEHLQGATGDEFRLGALGRILVSGRSFWFYLGKLLFPYHLTFFYGRWNVNTTVWWQYLYPAATVGALGGLWLLRKRAGRGPFVAMLHFYIATSMLVLIQVLYMMRYTFVSDHWQYFGCMGVFAAAAVGIDRAFDCVKQSGWPLKWPCYGMLLLGLGGLTWQQCGMYTDVKTLWRVTIAKNPSCWVAYNNLGDELVQAGQLDEAIAHFQKALEIDPEYAKAHYNLGNALLQNGQVDTAIVQFQKALELQPGNELAHNNLGSAFLQKGEVDEAIAQFQKAIEIHPALAKAYNNLANALLQERRVDEAIVQYQKALDIDPEYAKAHYNLGNVLLQKGQADEAIVQYQKAVEVQPVNAEFRNKLGYALLQKGRLDEAILQFQEVLKLQPRDAESSYNLGNAFLQKGEVRQAVEYFQKALEIRPAYAGALNNLAWSLATSTEVSVRNGIRAVALAEQANQLSQGTNPAVLSTLAAAYAEAGRFPEAIATAEQAQQLAAQQGNPARAEVLGRHIKLYQAGTPFRDPGVPAVLTSPAVP
jgi:tetratricopeptide (TPR) repeat protein